MATKNEQAENEYKNTPRISHPSTHKFKDPTLKFSIVFPSRERVELLKKNLDSFKNNTMNLEDIEVLIAVDSDDKATFDFLSNEAYSFVRIHQVMRSMNFSRDYYNYLASQSCGRWIITANDDCVCETPGWDQLAYDILKDKPGVIYGWIQDGIEGFRAQGHGNYCCFPLQGRRGYEALGYIFPSRIPTWGADIWAKNLYDQIDSVVELPITLKHYCHHNKTREQDQISKRIARNQVPMDMRPAYDEVNRLLVAFKKEMVKV